MSPVVDLVEHGAIALVWISTDLAAAMLLAVVTVRILLTSHEAWRKWIIRRYAPTVAQALQGDEDALRSLARSLPWQRFTLARVLVLPLVSDRDPRRIAAARVAVRTLALRRYCLRLLRSLFWWRRALGLRAIGLLKLENYLPTVVAALDDPHPDVRNSALDALGDLGSPSALSALVVRLHDSSLHIGRRADALAAFGSQCEEFLLDLARLDPEHRLNYARALAICGTVRARPTLVEWMGDSRPEVRAAALEALRRVGLDPEAARLAVRALESPHAAERANAAGALEGIGETGLAEMLARRLDDDTWTVAVRAARTLRSLPDGRPQLEARAARGEDLPAVLARQMLWEASHPRTGTPGPEAHS